MDDQQAAALAEQDNVRAAAQLITEFYRLPECGTGGPLHVVTDDTNVDDDALRLADEYLRLDRYPAETVARAQEILGALRPMTVQERAVATVIADV